MAVQGERAGAVDGPSEDGGEDDRTGSCRQRAQHHHEAVDSATLGGVYRVVDRQRRVNEKLVRVVQEGRRGRGTKDETEGVLCLDHPVLGAETTKPG